MQRRFCFYRFLLFLGIFTYCGNMWGGETPVADNHLVEWVKECSSLSSSNLQILINFLYLSYRQAFLYEKSGEALITLKATIPSLHASIKHENNPLPVCQRYVHASKTFLAFNTLRHHSYLCWKQCATYLESIEDTTLQTVCEQLQLQGQKTIADYFTNDTSLSVSLSLLKNQLKLTHAQIMQSILAIEELFKNIAARITPDDIVPHADQAFQINQYIQNTIEQLSPPVYAIDQCLYTTLHVSSDFFLRYYSALYPYIPVSNRKILFGTNGLLPDEKQLLPAPEYCAK